MSERRSCRSEMQACLGALAPGCPSSKVAELTSLVDETMHGSARFYHNLPHALMVAESADPLDVLIGLFHDIVQVGVDQGIPPVVEPLLAGMIHSPAPLAYALVDSPQTRDDRIFEMVRGSFGYAHGQTLAPFGGQNEFLSALAAAKALASVVDESAVLAMTLGIEATVPFRQDADAVGRSALSTLATLNQRLSLGLSPETLRTQVKRAVRIANRDVRSFGENDLIALLDDTWALMYESSLELQRAEGANFGRYRQALQRMTRFLGSLSAPVIFRRFDDEPDAASFEALAHRTSRNLAVIGAIMQRKLLAASLLEAAADPSTATFRPQRHALAGAQGGARIDPAMQAVLAAGREAPIEFDIRQSPLAHEIAMSMSSADVEQSLYEVDPSGPVRASLLATVPEPVATKARALADHMMA